MERSVSHLPTIIGGLMFFVPLGILYGAMEFEDKEQLYDLDGATAVVLAIIALVGAIIFFKGTKTSLQNWWWWKIGKKGAITMVVVAVILISIVWYYLGEFGFL